MYIILIEWTLRSVFFQKHFKNRYDKCQCFPTASYGFNTNIFMLKEQWNCDGLDERRTCVMKWSSELPERASFLWSFFVSKISKSSNLMFVANDRWRFQYFYSSLYNKRLSKIGLWHIRVTSLSFVLWMVANLFYSLAQFFPQWPKKNRFIHKKNEWMKKNTNVFIDRDNQLGC